MMVALTHPVQPTCASGPHHPLLSTTEHLSKYQSAAGPALVVVLPVPMCQNVILQQHMP